MEHVQNILFEERNDYSLIELYKLFTKKDICKKNLNLILQSLKLQNLGYFILNNFLTFYEIIIIKSNSLLFYLKDFVAFIIFCFLLYDKDIRQSYSKSTKNYFSIGIAILSIKSILLQIYINENINPEYYLVICILMKMIYSSLKRNPDNKLYIIISKKNIIKIIQF